MYGLLILIVGLVIAIGSALAVMSISPVFLIGSAVGGYLIGLGAIRLND